MARKDFGKPSRGGDSAPAAGDGLRYRRIVAKFGTNLLTAGTDRLDLEVMSALVGQVARLHAEGVDVIVVTSGAIAAGRQTLSSRRDLADRGSYLNARNTLLALLELRAVPIVNENDVVAVEEIEDARIGDNANLSALVANLLDAA